ncbi:class I SAM-dependent methyltransferase [Desulfospira joergensenii]|uniref:class I SAM-dependent methyltransferase n=1 Tax=Desulfospira joergensenii TaxID=53329 RepID=UPI0012946499|nr:class I SAM-dependent methyltransferase [Desulfospira joergensenii]
MMTNTEDAMIDYYARRAAEYERIYARPERQADLQVLAQFLSRAFSGLQVLELACGTGYWTQFIARTAAAILSTDYNPEVLALAKPKDFGNCRVEFTRADAYSLENTAGGHWAGFHGFWWSHVPVARRSQFLSVFHSRLSPGAKVVMIDNVCVEGSSTPVLRRDPEGNTYQLRRLDDGSGHEVLKNFPSDSDLHASLSGCATDIKVRRLPYFWITEYKTAGMPDNSINTDGNAAGLLSRQ